MLAPNERRYESLRLLLQLAGVIYHPREQLAKRRRIGIEFELIPPSAFNLADN